MVRLKVRYVLFDIHYPNEGSKGIEGKHLMKTLRTSIETNFGDLGIGSCQTTLALRYFNTKTSSGIIRIGRSQAPIVQGALSLITSIDGVDVVIQVTHISGTIKKCRSKALGLRKDELLDMVDDI